MFVAGLGCLAGCRSQLGPPLFFDDAWHASAVEKGAVWFFPAVDEADGWDESRVDRVRCPWIGPRYWCAPVEVSSSSPLNSSVYGDGDGRSDPFGVAITAKLPRKVFGVRVRNQSYSFMGLFGMDCPPEGRAFPVRPQSFTVVEIDSRAYRVELGTQRYCPSTSILGTVSHAPGREAARRAIDLAGEAAAHPAMRIAALEALARSTDEESCLEVRDLVRRIQDADSRQRVRAYAKERWPPGATLRSGCGSRRP